MNMLTDAPYALWLIPSDDQYHVLRATIDDLAAKLETPRFGPHATLCSGKWTGSIEALKSEMDALCQKLDPVSMPVESLGQSGGRFTAFYIKLADEEVQQLFDLAVASIPGSHRPGIGPHVSLIYTDNASKIDRAALELEIRPRLPQRIGFASVQLVLPATGSWTDVESWKVEHEARL